MASYGDEFYGGVFYGVGGAAADVPRNLQFFRTNTEGQYIFHWTFLEAFITPTLATLDWELEIDDDVAFPSPTTFIKTTATVFQDGNVAKGYEIPVAARLERVDQTFFARVRTVNGAHKSEFSKILQWVVPKRFQEEAAEDILNALPDENVYDKDVLKRDDDDRDTNLFGFLYRMYGEQFDVLQLERILTKGDVFLTASRDEALFDNFGTFFQFVKPSTITNVEYRRCLQALFLAALSGGTGLAIDTVIKCFTGASPSITDVRDDLSFIAVDSESDPSVSFLDPADPPILVSQSNAAFGVEVFLNNPGAFTLDVNLISFLVRQIAPAHVNLKVLV